MRSILRRLYRHLHTEAQTTPDDPLIRMLERGTRYCTDAVKVIFEVGANHGQHADLLRRYYKIRPENVFVFEPHPDLAAEIRRHHPEMNLFPLALSNRTGRSKFMAAPVGSPNDGVSTLGERVLLTGAECYRPIEVDVDTLDNVMARLPDVKRIDLMKIDVEGFTFEVLEGGQKTLREKVVALQLEAEVVEVFKGQKLYPEIAALLTKSGFIETYKEQSVTQNDTVWVHQRFWAKPEAFYSNARQV